MGRGCNMGFGWPPPAIGGGLVGEAVGRNQRRGGMKNERDEGDLEKKSVRKIKKKEREEGRPLGDLGCRRPLGERLRAAVVGERGEIREEKKSWRETKEKR